MRLVKGHTVGCWDILKVAVGTGMCTRRNMQKTPLPRKSLHGPHLGTSGLQV